MEFVKEFAVFLHQKGIIKFGDFTLASGKKSPYYVDLRLVPSYPHEFRVMIKHLTSQVIQEVGLDRFDSIASVPTGGLIVATALAVQTLKPLIYVRGKPKDYGTAKSVEGVIRQGTNAVIVDDVVTTGGSVVNAVRALKDTGISVKHAYVIVDRMQGAQKVFSELDVQMHALLNILQIAETLHDQSLIDTAVLEKVKTQIEI